MAIFLHHHPNFRLLPSPRQTVGPQASLRAPIASLRCHNPVLPFTAILDYSHRDPPLGGEYHRRLLRLKTTSGELPTSPWSHRIKSHVDWCFVAHTRTPQPLAHGVTASRASPIAILSGREEPPFILIPVVHIRSSHTSSAHKNLAVDRRFNDPQPFGAIDPWAALA
jgi:hypothetical protein